MPLNGRDKSQYNKKHYEDNKEKYLESHRRWRRSVRQELEDLKTSRPCADCKQFWPSCVMDFDHRDPTEKTANINVLVRCASKKRLMEEIAKCDLVCANCHRIRTDKRSKGLL